MDIIELAAEKPKPEFNFKEARTPGKTIFETTDLVIGYDTPLSKPINVRMEKRRKDSNVRRKRHRKVHSVKKYLGFDTCTFREDRTWRLS